MKLRFVAYRRREKIEQMTDDEINVIYSGGWLRKRRLTVAQKRAEMAELWADEFSPLEIVDVVDPAGARRYWMCFGCGGSAWVFDAKTRKMIAGAAQHSLDTCISRELWEALGEAYRTSKPPIRQRINFAVSDDTRFQR
jgi:hypothetical protein